jgi:cell division transport system permease protein
MFEGIFVSAAERRLLGVARLGGPTPWVIAIMSFSIMLIAAAGLALANTASVLSRAIETRYALEVPAGSANLNSILGAVHATPGVTSAEAVPEGEMRATLERWLGPAAQSQDLPVPALINFNSGAGARLDQLQKQVDRLAPGSRIVAHRDNVAPLLHSLELLQGITLGLVLLLSAAAAAAVVLAARGALDTHRFTMEVMHGIGATDLQITHLFQRKILIDSMIGSIAGAFAAAIILLLLASGAAFAGELTGGATLNLVDLLVLALLPVLLTALATWVARVAVLQALAEVL